MKRFLYLLCLLPSLVSFAQESSAIDGTTIMRAVFLQKHNNNPRETFDHFQYKTYSKTVIATKDSSNNFVSKQDTDYIYEQIALHQFHQKNQYQEKILSVYMPGFQKPVYSLFEKSWYAQSIYESIISLYDKKFKGVVSKNADKHYIFKLTNTVTNTERPYYIVEFSSKKGKEFTNISGTLHIDTKSFAVQYAAISHNGHLEMEWQIEYTFVNEHWFPQESRFSILPIDNLESFGLFNEVVSLGKLTVNKKEKHVTSLTNFTRYYELNTDETNDIQNKNTSIEATSVENKTFSKDTLFTFSGQEQRIATYADSLVKQKHIEDKITGAANFNLGFLKLGFFTFDLKTLIKFNNYEGLRLGIGGDTNEDLSDVFSVGGYLVRGFKDEKFKYQLRSKFNLSKDNTTSLELRYTDDITEIGNHRYLTQQRQFSLFEPRLVNIIQFFKHKSWELQLSHRLNARLFSEWEIAISDISQIENYAFTTDGNTFSNYRLTETVAGILWTPFSNYINTPDGLKSYKPGFPAFSAQFTKGHQGFLEGDFDYTKIDLKVDYTIDHINQNKTEFIFEGNLGLGDLPLTHAYHAFPNNPTKATLMKRFSVAGIRSFETMYFGEFFSDRLLSLHIKHKLRPLLISQKIQPQIVFLSRHALGDFKNIENHKGISFNTLEHGYSETGLEINKIIFGFGLSFAYRHGAYHLPSFEDNFSFKFTFDLKL